MKKRILITGAGSGLGEGTAIGLAKEGYNVIAGVHIWPQLTRLRDKARSLGLDTLRVEKLDILDPIDVDYAAEWDIDILVNNAAIGYAGPLAEIPLELIQRTFDTNVFGSLYLTQRFVRKFIDENRSGKIVFISSIAGLTSVPGLGPYCASKFALEAIAQALQEELKSHSIQVQTINPAAFKTGFNDAMAETAYHWMDDDKNFSKKDDVEGFLKSLFANQHDPQDMIEQMVAIIPEYSGKFRTVYPETEEKLVKTLQEALWEKKI